MHLILIIIGLLLLFILVPILIISLVAYAKIRTLWYKITGRPEPNPFSSFSGGFNTQSKQQSTNNSSRQSSQQHTSQSTSANNNGKKIFSANEGEYVDFEMVD